MQITTKTKVGLLRMMMRIRTFELSVMEHFHKGEIPGFAHLYVGEEAVAAGVCAALKADDYITHIKGIPY